MAEPKACDYALPKEGADILRGAVLLPADMRRKLLRRYLRSHDVPALIDLFAQFIGLANSVIANNREMIELHHITENGMHPNQAEQINLPNLFGALHGVELALGVDQAKVCGGCAFRLGAPANQCQPTTADAAWCLINESDPFFCHEDMDDSGRPKHLCRGFAQRRKVAAL